MVSVAPGIYPPNHKALDRKPCTAWILFQEKLVSYLGQPVTTVCRPGHSVCGQPDRLICDHHRPLRNLGRQTPRATPPTIGLSLCGAPQSPAGVSLCFLGLGQLFLDSWLDLLGAAPPAFRCWSCCCCSSGSYCRSPPAPFSPAAPRFLALWVNGFWLRGDAAGPREP